MRTLLEGEQEEVDAYFPELHERLTKLDQQFSAFMNRLTTNVIDLLRSVESEPDERVRQKSIALEAKS